MNVILNTDEIRNAIGVGVRIQMRVLEWNPVMYLQVHAGCALTHSTCPYVTRRSTESVLLGVGKRPCNARPPDTGSRTSCPGLRLRRPPLLWPFVIRRPEVQYRQHDRAASPDGAGDAHAAHPNLRPAENDASLLQIGKDGPRERQTCTRWPAGSIGEHGLGTVSLLRRRSRSRLCGRHPARA